MLVTDVSSQPVLTGFFFFFFYEYSVIFNCSAYRKRNMQLATRGSVRQTNMLSATKLPSVPGNTDGD